MVPWKRKSETAIFNMTKEVYLNAKDTKDQLRFLTCGSVDDGKSTLLGRLLFDGSLLLR